MPKVYCYLNQKIIDQLEQIKQDDGYDSSSQLMKEMIELGIKIYLINKSNEPVDDAEKRRLEKEEELNRQHTTNLLRILGITTDIFRCVFDKEKINTTALSADDQIAKIKDKVDSFIDGYINN